MPHTNNANAKARKANRHDPRKPAFLKRAPKPKKATVDGEDGAAVEAETPPDPGAVKAPAPPPKSAPAASRSQYTAIITEFHTLEKQIAASQDPAQRAKLRERQRELGGLEAYQEASIHGGDKIRGGESGKQCVQWLKELKVGVDPKGKGKVQPEIVVEDGKISKVYPKVEREKLRLLDVGGITGTSYADWKWIDTTYIDLNPQGPDVQKYDFFDFPPPPADKLFDVIGMSLVINFVGSLSKRGEMLQHAHKFLKPEGYLYLVLPLPCVTNSRYMNHERLESILNTTGWEKAKQRDTAKLTYWIVRRAEDKRDDTKVWKKEEIRAGVHRNNFCIVVNGGKEELETAEGAAGDKAEDGEEEEPEWTGLSSTVEPAAVEEEEEWGGVQEPVQVEEDEEEWGGI